MQGLPLPAIPPHVLRVDGGRDIERRRRRQRHATPLRWLPRGLVRRPGEQRRQGRDLRKWALDRRDPDPRHHVRALDISGRRQRRQGPRHRNGSLLRHLQPGHRVLDQGRGTMDLHAAPPVRKCQPRRHGLDPRWPRGHLVHWLQGHLDGVPVIVPPGLSVVRGVRPVLLRGHQPGDYVQRSH